MNQDQVIRDRINAENIAFVDLRAVDLSGRLRHLTLPASRVSSHGVDGGVGFDASSYGYRPVSGSDLILLPNSSTGFVETWGEDRVLVMMADIGEAETGVPIADAPRQVARRAVAHLVETGIADEAVVSPEFEFYVFERLGVNSGGLQTAPVEGEHAGTRPELREEASVGYHAPTCRDPLFALRNRMTAAVEAAGIPVKYHHHEVGRLGQHEIEVGFASLVEMADATLIVKETVRRVAQHAGLEATFLPKPVYGEPGSGMHVHQFLRKGEVNLFSAARRGRLSETALCYIGGVLTHGRSLMGLTNPSTNSYRRLVPGYEAPTHFVCGVADRGAAIRVPAYASVDMTRVELRTIDATCNPYLAYAAILLAGLDGIVRNLNAARLGLGPDGPISSDGKEAPRSLSEALAALADDHDYLLAGDAFSEEFIRQWIAMKTSEADAVACRPHPYEMSLYGDL